VPNSIGSRRPAGIYPLLAVFVILLWLTLAAVAADDRTAVAADAGAAAAQKSDAGTGQTAPDGNDKANKKVYITSDHLLTDNAARTAEFTGNVRATQDQTVVTCRRLKVFYASEGAADQPDAATLRKIEAYGNVVIETEDRVARTEEAHYTPADGLLVLIGEGSTVTSGENTVRGARITFNRNTDRITVERSPTQRVEAVFYSEGQGLQ